MKKYKLKKLKVQSFITILPQREGLTVVGGTVANIMCGGTSRKPIGPNDTKIGDKNCISGPFSGK